eukprot:scaffold13303_cov78-Skeletonema_dohrnii-CCMP3373.AAC.6
MPPSTLKTASYHQQIVADSVVLLYVLNDTTSWAWCHSVVPCHPKTLPIRSRPKRVASGSWPRQRQLYVPIPTLIGTA